MATAFQKLKPLGAYGALGAYQKLTTAIATRAAGGGTLKQQSFQQGARGAGSTTARSAATIARDAVWAFDAGALEWSRTLVFKGNAVQQRWPSGRLFDAETGTDISTHPLALEIRATAPEPKTPPGAVGAGALAGAAVCGLLGVAALLVAMKR